jgi:hypothetical protein
MGGIIFVSKTAAVVLAFLSLMLIPTASKAQLLPSGNVYGGVGFGDNVNVVNRQTYRGWEGSAEAFPFKKYRYLGIVLDGSGFYRTGITQYNLVLGPRVSKSYGKWRVFAHVMGGYQESKSAGIPYHAVLEDAGGGADRKLPFKNFAWRLQFDYIHSHQLSANQNDFRGTTGVVWRF